MCSHDCIRLFEQALTATLTPSPDPTTLTADKALRSQLQTCQECDPDLTRNHASDTLAHITGLMLVEHSRQTLLSALEDLEVDTDVDRAKRLRRMTFVAICGFQVHAAPVDIIDSVCLVVRAAMSSPKTPSDDAPCANS